MFFLNHIYLIPLFPAFGAAMMFFFGRRLQKATVNAVCVGAVVLAFLFACFAVWQYTHFAARHHQPFEKIVYTWLGQRRRASELRQERRLAAAFNVDAGFLLDPLSSIWLLFVTGVGMLIHIYSTGYMAHEGGYYRFFGYLNLFMFSMLTLILANNYMLAVRGMGRRGPVLVSADRFLFSSQLGFDRGQQGVHREPHRRCRIHSRRAHAGLVSGLVPLHRHQRAGAQWTLRRSAIPFSRPPRCCCS
jgi:hypothetical protein